MRALVLGGRGMLGRAVTAEWRRRGWAVLALDREQADIRDRERLTYWAGQFTPEVIVNCAAFTMVDACEEQQERAFEINGEAVGHALAAARAANACLIQISSDYVFDGQAETPIVEDAPTGPQSIYGKSKLQGEQEALADPTALIVRASWLFGPYGPNFVATIRRFLLEGRSPLKVVDDQIGRPTYTPFLARALADLAARRASGIVHYGNREGVSWHGLATEIARAVAPQIPIVPVKTTEFPRPAKRPAYSLLDVSRFEALVGRRVEPWIAGLVAYLDFLESHPS